MMVQRGEGDAHLRQHCPSRNICHSTYKEESEVRSALSTGSWKPVSKSEAPVQLSFDPELNKRDQDYKTGNVKQKSTSLKVKSKKAELFAVTVEILTKKRIFHLCKKQP